MTKFPVLTPEAQKIVVNFFSNQMMKKISNVPSYQLMVSLYGLMPDANSEVLKILNEFKVQLDEILSEPEIEILKSEYPAVVKFCFDNRDNGFRFNNKENGVISQSLIELCLGLAKPQAGSSVFIPFADDGGFAYYASDCKIKGFAQEEPHWALTQILLHSQNVTSDIALGNTDIPVGECYNYIFSFPPILTRGKDREVIETIYNLITKHLADNGELYCILPMSFCSASSGWYDVRKILKDYQGQYSVLVVSLPHWLLPFSSVSLCLLHILKSNKDIVALVDASGEEFSARHDVAGYKEYGLKVQSIIETIKSQDEKNVWVGTSTQLTGDVNLQPSRYLVSQIIPIRKKGEISIRLADVMEIVPTYERHALRHDRNFPTLINNQDIPTKAVSKDALMDLERRAYSRRNQTILINDLSSTYLNCDINVNGINANRDIHDWKVLTSDCLLVGFQSGKFKVGRVQNVSFDHPITVQRDIIAFKVTSNLVTEDFLLRCIMSDSAERQARMLATGTTVTRLSKQDLLSIVINVPELKEQQDTFCKEDTRRSLTDASRKLIESDEEFRKDLHMVKHAIGQTIFNINNWWNLLKLARYKGNGIVDDRTELGSNRKVKVAEIYTNLEIAMTKLSTQLSKFDTGYGLQTENIPLTVFIEQYISEHKSPLFEYIYDSLAHHAENDMPELDFDEKTMTAVPASKFILREGEPLEYAIFAPEALTIVFNNIVSNACAHGFRENRDKKNLIRIEILSEGTDYVIAISNNGEPIRDITAEEVLIYGLTTQHTRTTDVPKSHFGIGGYEIKKLMTEFNGDVEIISTPEEEFSVTYRLIFHDTNVKYAF